MATTRPPVVNTSPSFLLSPLSFLLLTGDRYKYHPGGDPRNAPKEAPSALHSVIVPNVNLPKELHEKYNKWGKDGY
jgi:hypothetical protein